MSSACKKIPRRRPLWRNQHDVFGYFLVMSGLHEIQEILVLPVGIFFFLLLNC